MARHGELERTIYEDWSDDPLGVRYDQEGGSANPQMVLLMELFEEIEVSYSGGKDKAGGRESLSADDQMPSRVLVDAFEGYRGLDFDKSGPAGLGSRPSGDQHGGLVERCIGNFDAHRTWSVERAGKAFGFGVLDLPDHCSQAQLARICYEGGDLGFMS